MPKPKETDPWEQRKVSELLEERNEQAPQSDDYPLMAFVANEGVAPKGERYDRSALINDAENKLYKRTRKGDFIYSSNNLETGSIGLNNLGNACISPVYSIFKPTKNVSPEFIGRSFLRKEFINKMVKYRQGVIYGQWRIHETDFLRIKTLAPSLGEQQKIGSFFRDLDALITLHQRKCRSRAKDAGKGHVGLPSGVLSNLHRAHVHPSLRYCTPRILSVWAILDSNSAISRSSCSSKRLTSSRSISSSSSNVST